MEMELCRRAGFSPITQLQLFEEISGTDVRPLSDRSRQLGELLDKLMDGNIIVFQPICPDQPDASQFFIDSLNRVDVLLCDKNDPMDPGFLVSLNRNCYYAEVCCFLIHCLLGFGY